VQRPGMRLVPVKNEQQQSLLMLHRIRDRLIAGRTGTINAIRGHTWPSSEWWRPNATPA
jgi:transposase